VGNRRKIGGAGGFNKKFQALDHDGLAKIGVPLNSGDLYVNKKTPMIPP
jgi:hypothetical protein